MKKNKRFVLVCMLAGVMMLTSCKGIRFPNGDKNQGTVGSVPTDTDAKADVKEITTETHSMEYFEMIKSDYSETIEYKEVYNKDGIIIKSVDYVHDDTDCYVKIEIMNTTEQDIIVNEMSYSVNYVTYYGAIMNDSFTRYAEMSKVKVAAGQKTNMKIHVVDLLQYVCNQNVKDIQTMLYIEDDKEEKVLSKALLDFSTSKQDYIAEYLEYPAFYSDDKFSYELMKDYKEGDYYQFGIPIYNKTDDWYSYTVKSFSINGYTAIEDSYQDSTDSINPNMDGDYYTGRKMYILPNCKNMIHVFFESPEFFDNNDIDKINKISVVLEVKTNDDDDSTFVTKEITYSPVFE